MRYEIHEIKTSDDHPFYQGRVCWRIFDTKNEYYGFSSYTTLERAEYWLDRKNFKL